MKRIFSHFKGFASRKKAVPELSIIVVCFNMRREAPRTLYTLSRPYQCEVDEVNYEIIVIDNGSSQPLDKESTESIADNIRYVYLDTKSKSPAAAMNYGASLASGKYLACIVDGARMVTPRSLYFSLMAARSSSAPFVTSLAWHLGFKEQNESMLEGYDQKTEDELLDSVDWQKNGYELFDIASQASSSSVGLLGGLPYESSFFVMRRSHFFEQGGFDERFQTPGGGLVNQAFLQALIASEKFNYFVLLGEGSFHQFHGGVATNAKPEEHPMQIFLDEYKRIYNYPYEPNQKVDDQSIFYLGTAPVSSLRFLNANLPKS